jgi:trehalose 6-phosphate synthase
VRTAGDRTILVEDYHLMFVADDLSARVPGPTAYFHHVPWCEPALFSVLPDALRTEILGKILRFDTIGFHSGRWARAFLACCAEFLPGVRVSGERTRGGRVVWRDRDVPVVVAPAQVDAERIVRTAAGAASQRWRDSMSVDERPVIARVDRVDLWKNVVRGFLAFERLLEAGTEATFLALLARSRTHLSEYRRYLDACVREAGRINERFPRAGGPPIRLMLADSSDHDRALAVLGLADVVLVNSTCDGLNLVAKESVVAGGGRSRLVLSETTGVHEEIGEWTYGVHPFDIDGTGEAMVAALAADSVPLGLVESVWHNSAETWLSRRLAPVAG